MAKLLRLVVVCAFLAVAFPGARTAAAQTAAAQQRKDDLVTLKDGRIIRGRIIEFFPNDSTFLMRLTDGSFARFNKADIAERSQATALRPNEVHQNLKNPALAWLLSFLITGGGQIYNEDVWKGLGLLAAGATGTVLYLSGSSDECGGGPECSTKQNAGAVMAVAMWLVSQIEAPLKASAINREVRGHFALGLWPEPHALGVSLVHLEF